METFLYDLRHAVRSLGRRPLLATVAVLSIAIGIGANTAILSVADVLLFRPLAGVGDAARSVELSRTVGGRGRDTFTYQELLDLRAMGGEAFEQLAGWRLADVSYAPSGSDAERLNGLAASWNYFTVLGVEPRLGRFFAADEDQVPMGSSVAVVSEAFWESRLGADPAVIGRTITFNRAPFTIVGVAPASFSSHVTGITFDVFVPLTMYPALRPGTEVFEDRGASWMQMLGRLAPGVSIEQADAVAGAAFARMPQRSSDPRNARGAIVDPLGPVPAVARAPASAFLGILLALSGIILLVACANVAGMLLARAASRSREIAVRLALGSTRARLTRHLFTEAMLLFAIGGGLGAALAIAATRALSSIPLPVPLAIDLDFRPDVRVLLLGLALSLVTGAFFGVVPALQASGRELAGAMKPGGDAIGHAGRLRRAFVMGQIGLSVLLLLCAGLFLRSLQRAANVATGFDPAGVQMSSFDLSIDGYDAARGQVFLAALLTRLRSEPGVEAAGLVSDPPLDLGITESTVYAEGAASAGPDGAIQAAYTTVSDGYFETLRIPLMQGRTFDVRDVAGAAPVVVVSRAFAEQAWPGQDPVGRLVRSGGADEPPATVVGVVADVKQQLLMEAPQPALYLPVMQAYEQNLYVVARAAGGADVGPTLRRALQEADPMLSTTPIRSLASVTALGILPQRLAASITSALGALALLLSALGVYGVIAFAVSQRTREIGVRRAVGARSADISRLVLFGGLALAVPGLVCGVALGLALSVLLRSFLLGLAPADPVTFIGMPALLLVVMGAACWAPARRAAAVEPTAALRAE
jgi:predicted permease